MSGVNITILEGGKAENFGQVTKLRTSNGSDHDLWVPKTDVETKHLSVKKNGLHYTNQYEPTASEKKDGKFHDIYGWDTITVSVKKKVTGKKKKINPSTGVEYDVPTSVDADDNGNLIETELPTSIEIVEPPSKLQYHNGESISKTGMIVKAYYADDREWGTVPLNEIGLDPATASGSDDEYSDDTGQINVVVITYTVPIQMFGSTWYTSAIDTGFADGYRYKYALPRIGKLAHTTYNGYGYIAMIDDSTATIGLVRDGSQWGASSFGGQRNTFRQKDIAYSNLMPESSIAPTTMDVLHPSGGSQTITVGWTPDDGEDELTDTFDITIIPSN